MFTKNLIVPQTSDLLEKLALIFLYNFYCDHISLKLKIKKLLPKINVKNIKLEFSKGNNTCNRSRYIHTSIIINILTIYLGAQWLSGRVLDSRPRVCGFEPHQGH